MATDTSSPRPQKPAKIQRFKISLNVLVQFVALVLILAMVNYLSFNHFKRWDFTRTHHYALSDKTKRVMEGLKKKTSIIVFFSTGSDIAADAINLLREYQYASNGRISVEIVDPVRNKSRADELEGAYKLGQQENVVIIDYDGRRKYIKDVDMAEYDHSGEMYGQPPTLTAFKGEQAITGALLEVSDDKPNILYAVTGHGERDITTPDYAPIRGYIERENVKVQPLDLQSVDAVPNDAGILLVLGARYDFSDREMKILRDYWDKKGRLVILLDPEAQQQMHALTGFLEEQGIRPEDDRILRVERTDVISIAKLIKDVTASFIDGSPVTKNLNDVTGVFLGETQSLTLDQAAAQNAGVRLQALAQASQGYWGEVNYNIHDGDPVPFFQPKKDFGQPLVVVASAEKGGLKNEQVDSSRMIVAGNYEYVSQQSLTAGNLDFTVNGIDWLLDRTELIGIAPKAYDALQLTLTDKQITDILVTMTFIIPGVVGFLGILLWWKRRH